MEDIIVKPIDPIALAASIEDDPSKQANSAVQEKMAGQRVIRPSVSERDRGEPPEY